MIDRQEIERLVAEGTVKAARHPTAPLTIYNYTAVCQFEQRWCRTSRACRGLIIHDDGRIVARPFPKFHNLDEHSRSEVAFSKPFTVTEKLDGSLGILYPLGDGWAIATRGSFTSDQAVWATQYLQSQYLQRGDFEPDPSNTYLFEIVYAANRIVVDYGAREELVLLAVIDTATGRDLDANAGWPGPVVHRYDISCKPTDVLAAIALTDDGSNEGVVLRFDWPRTGPHFRAKVKLEEYKRLHRLITGTSTKTVWEALAAGQELQSLAERVPDEFYQWLNTTVADFRARFEEEDRRIRALYEVVRGVVGPDADRKTFASEAVKHRDKAYLFRLLDGYGIEDMIWKALRPEYARPFKNQGEDVA